MAAIITKPGVYEDIPFEDYKLIRAWSPSSVLPGRISMLQLNWERSHEKVLTTAQKDKMKQGSAVHCCVLEPDNLPRRYAKWDGGTRRGKEWDAWQDANPGMDDLTPDKYDLALAARDSVKNHALAGPIVTSKTAKREVSLVWTDRESGLLCKGRLDSLDDIIADIKTTGAHVADVRKLKGIASDLSYDVRMAAYQAGVFELTGETKPVKIVWVEQNPPHDCRVMAVPSAVLAGGWDVWQKLLGQIAECERTGNWPGCDPTGEPELEIYGAGMEQADLEGLEEV